VTIRKEAFLFRESRVGEDTINCAGDISAASEPGLGVVMGTSNVYDLRALAAS
jgi:hypothetical protein